MLKNFQKAIEKMGLKSHDCHGNLPRDNEFRGLGLGGGSICIEEAWLFVGIIASCKPDIVLELGTSNGASTLAIAAILKDFDRGSITTVDLAQSPPKKAESLARDLGLNNITWDSANSLKYLAETEFDQSKTYLVFSDTNIPERPLEVRLVSQRLPKGTVVVVHDTRDEHPFGPMNLQAKINQQTVMMPTPRGISILTT
jgi:predicted O-methyltransferase YrrM